MKISTYNEMFKKFQTGQISKEVWIEFCDRIFEEILKKNQEIFVRMKYR